MNRDIMTSLGFGKEVQRIAEDGRCPFCNTPIDENCFRDELSKKEFKISGICPSCQDETFKE